MKDDPSLLFSYLSYILLYFSSFIIFDANMVDIKTQKLKVKLIISKKTKIKFEIELDTTVTYIEKPKL